MKIILSFLTGLLLFWNVAVQAQNFGSLDGVAKRLPTRPVQTKEQVVKQLTDKLKKPIDKARILAAWVAYQVDRNGYEYNELLKASSDNTLAPAPLPNDIFKTRIGTPKEYADLYAELCRMAGLDVVVIDGYAGYNIPSSRYDGKLMKALEPTINRVLGGNYRLQRYMAAWNAVQIDGKWHLVDTYWMANPFERMVGRGESARGMMSLLRRRERNMPSAGSLSSGKSLNDDFFFAKPRDFVKTHFPFESKWQLLPVPKTWSSFTN